MFGDLNYRIAGLEASAVREMIEHKKGKALDELLSFDELIMNRNANRTFSGFTEGKIDFLPTYKFTPHSDEYDRG
ncbi:unnamed protein product [Protopolystoma xenopodis]|uniref:Inositol polyphosphate-related phosphatase domain-containing protein n=1 Tax=Protopolystoma xenopodis TaxID=117903 RepID=A0A448XPA6_9PLAT|nr:unnamed protein product [Protopolystoma xenopodis]